MNVLLETHNLRKEFGGLVAVDDVSIQIRSHMLHSIIGPNGAGKTTLFNLLSGTLIPTRGQVLYKGRDITHLSPHRIAHLGIGRSFQITNIFPNLTVLENVRLAAQAMGKDNFKLLRHFGRFSQYEEKAATVIKQVGLQGRETALARTLAHGDKRKLELGIMLASDPEVLLLDEPTAGMSSEQVPALLEIIRIDTCDCRMQVVKRLVGPITFKLLFHSLLELCPFIGSHLKPLIVLDHIGIKRLCIFCMIFISSRRRQPPKLVVA